MDKAIFKVDNPVYLTKDEIREKYWNHQVLLTNVEMTPKQDAMAGGIVRYYGVDSMNELYSLLKKLRDTEGDDRIESCSVQYIGNIYLNLYAGGDDS
ncbi:MAG: hypothetical protein FWH48_09270 [Oscillospiraceae bacterium]|nr:hypothetical protein [Oscillospiraceae bacterium]